MKPFLEHSRSQELENAKSRPGQSDRGTLVCITLHSVQSGLRLRRLRECDQAARGAAAENNLRWALLQGVDPPKRQRVKYLNYNSEIETYAIET
jgi:hypothetical protein